MNENEDLIALFKALFNDPKVATQPGWQKLVLIGSVEGSTRIAGYSFDLAGNYKPVSPDLDSLLLLRDLHKSMRANNPNGRGWKSCLLRIARNGEVNADFEYSDAARWEVTPNNLEKRIKEFAAMPI